MCEYKRNGVELVKEVEIGIKWKSAYGMVRIPQAPSPLASRMPGSKISSPEAGNPRSEDSSLSNTGAQENTLVEV